MGRISLDGSWFNREVTALGRTFPASFRWSEVPTVLFEGAAP